MTKQNVIFLSPVGFFKGGAERSLFDLVANPNITPILIAPEDDEILKKARTLGMETHVLPFGSIQNVHRPFTFAKGIGAIKDLLKAASTLKRIARSSNAKIVHSNGLKAHMINCVSRRLGGARAVLHIRDIPYTSTEKKVWHIMEILCDAMIMVSHACWPGKTLPKKVHVIHNGTPLIDSEINTSNEHDILTCAFIGRIHPAKGLHLLIDWIAEARQSGLNVALTVRGTFSKDAASYENEINQQIEQLAIKDHVTFTGFIDNPETLYDGVNLVVVPSHVPDPLPRSVMESMARGIPVLGYPAGGIFEMIEDGKTGYLVDDSQKFTQALSEIIGNPEKLKAMTEAAKHKIEQEFTIENLHKEVTELYKKL